MTRMQSKPINSPDACLFVALTEDLSPESKSIWEWTAWTISILTTVIIVFDLIYGFVNNIFDNSQSTETFLFYNAILSLFFIPICVTLAIALFANRKRSNMLWLTIFWIVILFVCSYLVTKI